jgi:hypothetical protein
MQSKNIQEQEEDWEECILLLSVSLLAILSPFVLLYNAEL